MARFNLTAFLLCCCLLAGCLRHRPEWAPALPSPSLAGAVASDLGAAVQEARQGTGRAGDREAVRRAIVLWQRVLEIQPENFEALVRIGDLELLLGAAYAATEGEKKQHYHAAMGWSERALATLPDFRERVDGGEPLWTAVDGVGAEAMEPMIKWVTAVFYLYEDTLSSVGRFLNVRWLERARQVMERMSEIDPDWGDGVLSFTWGIFHVALPPIAGGDRRLAAQELERALELDSHRLLYRWGRGRYLHVQTGNRQGFQEDLQWVVDQDPREGSGPYAWNAYFQRDALQLLEDVGTLFPRGSSSVTR